MESDKLFVKIKEFQGNRGDDFRLWAMRVMAYLEGKGLSDVVRQAVEEPSDRDELARYVDSCRKARAIIVGALGNKPLRAIQSAATPSEMWAKLHERYAGRTNANLISEMTTLFSIKLKKGTEMTDHVSELESSFNYLAAMGSPMSEQSQVSILLGSLSEFEEYRSVSSAIKTMNKEQTTWNAVSSKLIEEYKANAKEKTYSSRSKTTLAVVKKSHKAKAKRKIVCYRCDKEGHMARDCKTKIMVLNNEEPKMGQNGPGSKVRIAAATVNVFLKAAIDSGASQHIVNDKSVIWKIRKMDPVTIELADGRKMVAKQCGSITVILEPHEGQNTPVMLDGVYFIPGLDMSLISCSRLDEVGISCCFSMGFCQLIDRNENYKILGVGSRRVCDGLYEVGVAHVPKYSRASVCRGNARKFEGGLLLWHKRLGHCAKNTVRYMSSGIVAGMSLDDAPKRVDCNTCVTSKQQKSNCTGNLVKKTEEHVIHMDICGPMQTKSEGKAKYFLAMIVEKSRYAKVALLGQKSDAHSQLMEFIAWLERHTNITVKRVHSDNAKEFEVSEKHLAEMGITHSYSSPYTPQSNGVAERFIRTILGKVRAMLSQSGLTYSFWGEALKHGTLLYNVTSSKVIGGLTPFEALMHVKPDLSKLRVFGCLAYVHINKEKRENKFQARAEKCVLLSHSNGIYTVMNIATKVATETKHVVFDETVFPMHSDLPELIYEESSNQKGEGGETGSGTEPDITADPRYPRRNRKPPNRFRAGSARQKYVEDNPSLKDALGSPERHLWLAAMQKEIDALKGTKSWKYIRRPRGEKILHCKWVLRRKRLKNGKIDKYKARLVVCGNEEDEGEFETFAPVVDFTVVRLFLSIAAQRNWYIGQIDFGNTFLQGHLKRTVYMEIPKGIELAESNMVCELNKSLYGLKEAPRIWYERLCEELNKWGFTPLVNAPCVFRKGDVYILAYVDDLLLIGPEKRVVDEVKMQLGSKLPTTDLGKGEHFLGVDISQDHGSIRLKQSKGIRTLLKSLYLEDCGSVGSPMEPSDDLSVRTSKDAHISFPYREVIGSLLYISSRTRPDLAVATGILARHVESFDKKHVNAVIRVVKYLSSTKEVHLELKPGESNQITAHVDASWAAERGSERRSRSGIAIFYGNALIHFKSVLQKGVTLSSTEAEYVALSEASKTIVWLGRLLGEVGIPQMQTQIFQDNKGAIQWAEADPAREFAKSRHVDVRYHYTRSLIKEKEVYLSFIKGSEMLADILTKPLGPKDNKRMALKIGLHDDLGDSEEGCWAVESTERARERNH